MLVLDVLQHVCARLGAYEAAVVCRTCREAAAWMGGLLPADRVLPLHFPDPPRRGYFHHLAVPGRFATLDDALRACVRLNSAGAVVAGAGVLRVQYGGSVHYEVRTGRDDPRGSLADPIVFHAKGGDWHETAWTYTKY